MNMRVRGTANASRQKQLHRFFEYVVRSGGYTSEARLQFYCEWFFHDVPLEGKRLLDIGCGCGVLATYARLAGAEYCVGIEPEADGSHAGSMRAFRQMINAMAIDNVEVRPEELQSFATEPGAYDIVTMSSVINHLDEAACARLHVDIKAEREYVAFLVQVARVLRPGGFLVVTDCGRRNLLAWLPRLGIQHPFEPTINWAVHQEPKLWASLLARVGFGDIRVGWRVPNRLRALRLFLANGLVARCLTSEFRILAQRR